MKTCTKLQLSAKTLIFPRKSKVFYGADPPREAQLDPSGRLTQQEPYARALGNLNARTRERPPGQTDGRTDGRTGPGDSALGPEPGPEVKTLIFLRKIEVFYATATRRHCGKDNLAPAEDVHNKNPSLVALGKKNSDMPKIRV